MHSFKPDGKNKTYWLIDDTQQLQTLYSDFKAKATEPYAPLRIKLKGIDQGPTSEGFAADYDSVLRVLEVLNNKK